MTKTAANESLFSRFDLGGEYLKCKDFLRNGKFNVYPLTISEYLPGLSLKTADKRWIEQPIIGFKETKKRMILSKTNVETLHIICGTDEVSKLIGLKVLIQVRVVRFGKHKILGLRIIPPNGMILTKGLMERLGTQAEWIGTARNGDEIDSETDTRTEATGGSGEESVPADGE